MLRQSPRLHPGGARTRRGARSRAAVGPAGPRQDHAGADRRARDGRGLSRDLGPGDPARRRSRRAPHQSRGARRPVHRRDPPPLARGRGNALSGDGGFPARPDDRRGAGGALGEDRPAALHADRRHDPLRPHHAAIARALRHSPAPAILRAGRADRDRRARRARARGRAFARGRRRDRAARPRHAARRDAALTARARFRRRRQGEAHRRQGGR